MDEVQAPPLVGERQHRRRSPCTDGTAPVPPASDRQLLFAIKPLRLLPVDHHALPPQQDMQPAIAEPPALLRELAQLRPKIGIIIPLRSVAHALPISADNTTRPPLAHPQDRLETSDRLSLSSGRHQFFARRSFRPALSSIVSASRRLSLAFSSSSARRRFASETSKPP